MPFLASVSTVLQRWSANSQQPDIRHYTLISIVVATEETQLWLTEQYKLSRYQISAIVAQVKLVLRVHTVNHQRDFPDVLIAVIGTDCQFGVQ